jgi:hypothetical protein
VKSLNPSSCFSWCAIAIPDGPAYSGQHIQQKAIKYKVHTPMIMTDGASVMDWPATASIVCPATVIKVPPARPDATSMLSISFLL